MKIYCYNQETFKEIKKEVPKKTNIISILDYQKPEIVEDKKEHLVKESKEAKNIMTLDFDNILVDLDVYNRFYEVERKAFSTIMAERSIWFIEEQTRMGQDFYIICDHKEITDDFIQVILDFYGYLFEKPERELTPNIEVLFKLRSIGL